MTYGRTFFALALLGGFVVTAAAIAMPASNVAAVHSGATVRAGRDVARPGIIVYLHHIVTIGSTIDPINGDQNPYGLDIAKSTSGKMTAGDLVIANFNDGPNNIQGLGTTLEVLHPTPGSKPQRLAQDTRLTGTSAIALSPGDNPWVSAFTANDEPVLDSSGNVLINLSGSPFYKQPWGQAFSGTSGPYGVAAFYVSNSNDGSIVRINITRNGRFKPQVIATGFSVNHGVPGTVLAPAGLTYDPSVDTLYIVDSDANRVVAFKGVSSIPAHGITVQGSGFGGPAGSQARVVVSGMPLANPISAALLYDGHLVVGNTSNNLLLEIAPNLGRVLHSVNLDKGAPGALFGIVATGTSAATTKIYFNDDNDNTVKVLER